jgi:hypothetical protein
MPACFVARLTDGIAGNFGALTLKRGQYPNVGQVRERSYLVLVLGLAGVQQRFFGVLPE